MRPSVRLMWGVPLGSLLLVAGCGRGEEIVELGPPLPHDSFVGEVMAIDGPQVTYRVDEIRPWDGEGTPENPVPEVGTDLVIAYGDDARFLEVGESYLVAHFGEVNGLARGSGCSFPCATTLPDGSYVDTAVLAPMLWKLTWIAVGSFALIAVCVGGASAMQRRREMEPVEV